MDENKNSEINENAVSTENTQASEGVEQKDEKEFFERQYFSGDSLRELEGDDGEDEENEYLKAFDKASDTVNKKSKSGLKKQIIVLLSVFAVAVILLCTYFFVIKKNDDAEKRQYFGISEGCADTLGQVTENVEICFKNSEKAMEDDKYGYYIIEFALSFEQVFPNVNVKCETGSDYCTVRSGNKTVSYTEEDFYKTLENGVRYVFNGEILYGKAILEVTGHTDLENDKSFTIWAVPNSGYDTDGDLLGGSNRPFLYPNISRADVSSITVKNSYGTYKAYRGTTEDTKNTFFFENAELCSFDQEKFSSLVVNSTYVLSMGKIKDYESLADYGLESEEKAQAVITVETMDGKKHKILLGSEVPSGGAFYAKYDGKDFIYLLDDSYKNDVLQPATSFLTANLGYTLSNTNDIVKIEDMLFQYRKDNTDIYVSRKTDVVLSSNIESNNKELTIAEILHNKKYSSDNYSDWTADKSCIGIKASDGKEMTLEMQLTNYAVNTGEYAVAFSMIKDTEKNSDTPSSIVIKYYDADMEYTDENGEVKKGVWVEAAASSVFSQGDKSKKVYTMSFKAQTQVKYIRINITAEPGKYVVLDEITAYADGKDAIPNEAVSGIWKIVSPSSFIRKGYNYSIPDTSSFSDILYGVATLTGDSVMEYNIYSGDTDKTNALLAKYGLDDPAIAVSYLYDGYRSYIFFSELDEENDCYYAYASISYNDETGKQVNVSSNIIAKISHSNAAYLSWNAIDLLDRAAFTMYIDKIDTIEMTFDGKSYLFDLSDTDNDGKMDKVSYGNGVVDTKNFRYVYVSVLECTRAGVYNTKEGELTDDKILFTFKMHSDIKDTEVVFYRVSSTKVVYCINGEDSDFYVLYSDISTVMSNVIKLINGKDVPR